MITSEQYQNFIGRVVDELEGDWLVIGGSLLAMINSEYRVTSDIDICPIDEMTNEKRLHLMDIADQLKLPIEAINPAADFFVRQIPNWKSSIVLMKKGKKGLLYRPDIELYFNLKLSRQSQSDVEDCILFLNWHIKSHLRFNKNTLLSLVVDKEKLDLKIEVRLLLEKLKKLLSTTN